MNRDFNQIWQIKYDDEKKHWKSQISNKYLLSWSNLTKNKVQLNLAALPPMVVEQARDFGKTLMTNLEAVINANTPFDQITIYWQTRIIDLLNKLKTEFVGIKIIKCEKLICSNSKIGFIDLLAKEKNGNWLVFEIKTCSRYSKPKKSWLSQLSYYYQILKDNNMKTNRIKFYLLVFDKTTDKWHLELVQKDLLKTLSVTINDFLRLLD